MKLSNLIKVYLLDKLPKGMLSLEVKREIDSAIEKVEEREEKYSVRYLELCLDNPHAEEDKHQYIVSDGIAPSGVSGVGDSEESALLNYINNFREAQVTNTLETYIKVNRNVALALAISIDQQMKAHWFTFEQLIKESGLEETEVVSKVQTLELFGLIQKKRFGKTNNLLKFKIIIPKQKRIEILQQERDRYQASINSINERIKFIEKEKYPTEEEELKVESKIITLK